MEKHRTSKRQEESSSSFSGGRLPPINKVYKREDFSSSKSNEAETSFPAGGVSPAKMIRTSTIQKPRRETLHEEFSLSPSNKTETSSLSRFRKTEKPSQTPPAKKFWSRISQQHRETEESFSDGYKTPAKNVWSRISQQKRRDTEESFSDDHKTPAKKIRRYSSQQPRETEMSSSYGREIPAKKIRRELNQQPRETEKSFSDVTLPPAKKICRDPRKQPFKTEVSFSDDHKTPAKKRRYSSQQQRETERSSSDGRQIPAKKIRVELNQQPRETEKSFSDGRLPPAKKIIQQPLKTEVYFSDVTKPPVKKITRQQHREITPMSSLISPSKETEHFFRSPAKKIPTSKQRHETETPFSGVKIPAAKKITSQQPRHSSLIQSKETEDGDLLSGVITSPAKKIPTSTSKQWRETETSFSGVTIPPKITTNHSNKQLQDFSLLQHQETEDLLSGVSTSPAKKTTDQDSSVLRLFGVYITPEKKKNETNTRQEPREILFFPPKEVEASPSSVFPMSKDEISSSEEEGECEKGFVSTAICSHDETWPCPPRDEAIQTMVKELKKMRIQREQEEKKMWNRVFINDPWIVIKKLTNKDVHGHLYLRATVVETHILTFLSENEKIRKGGEGRKVKVYDTEKHTRHELLLVKSETNHGFYCLKHGWIKDFVNRRSLKMGDEVGLVWDQYSSELRFRVLSSVDEDKAAAL